MNCRIHGINWILQLMHNNKKIKNGDNCDGMLDGK